MLSATFQLRFLLHGWNWSTADFMATSCHLAGFHRPFDQPCKLESRHFMPACPQRVPLGEDPLKRGEGTRKAWSQFSIRGWSWRQINPWSKTEEKLWEVYEILCSKHFWGLLNQFAPHGYRRSGWYDLKSTWMCERQQIHSDFLRWHIFPINCPHNLVTHPVKAWGLFNITKGSLCLKDCRHKMKKDSNNPISHAKKYLLSFSK